MSLFLRGVEIPPQECCWFHRETQLYKNQTYVHFYCKLCSYRGLKQVSEAYESPDGTSSAVGVQHGVMGAMTAKSHRDVLASMLDDAPASRKKDGEFPKDNPDGKSQKTFMTEALQDIFFHEGWDLESFFAEKQWGDLLDDARIFFQNEKDEELEERKKKRQRPAQEEPGSSSRGSVTPNVRKEEVAASLAYLEGHTGRYGANYDGSVYTFRRLADEKFGRI
jgi:hypothetical protein